MSLLKTIKELSLEPDIENKYSCEFFDWFLENVYFVKEHTKYPTLWFVKQEPTYILSETNSRFLMNENYKKLMSYETRFLLFEDMKRWLIKSIKNNFVVGLDLC